MILNGFEWVVMVWLLLWSFAKSDIQSWGKSFVDAAGNSDVSMEITQAFSDGDFIVFGQVENEYSYYTFLSKINSVGEFAWVQEIDYGGLNVSIEVGSRISRIEEDEEVDIFITSNYRHYHHEDGSAHDDLLVAKFNYKNGTVIFSKIFGPILGGSQFSDRIFFSKMSDGNYVSVHQFESNKKVSSLVLKISSDGNILWKKIVSFGLFLELQTLVEKNEEYCFFGRIRVSESHSFNFLYLRLDPTTGDISITSPPNAYNFPHHSGGGYLTMDPNDETVQNVDQGFVVALTVLNQGMESTMIAKFSDDGTVMWTKKLFKNSTTTGVLTEIYHYSFIKKNNDDTSNSIIFGMLDVMDHILFISEMDPDGNIIMTRTITLNDRYYSVVGQKRKSDANYILLTSVILSNPTSSLIYNIDFQHGGCNIPSLNERLESLVTKIVEENVLKYELTEPGISLTNPGIIGEKSDIFTVKDRELSLHVEDTCFYCNGHISTDVHGCSSSGKCVGPNNCACEVNSYGSKCDIKECFGKLGNISSQVCSGHGDCVDYNMCVCTNQHSYDARFGSKCNLYMCYGKLSHDEEVCSGHGECTSNDNCKCEPSYDKYLDCGAKKKWIEYGDGERYNNVKESTTGKDATILVLAMFLLLSLLWSCVSTMLLTAFFAHKLGNYWKEKKALEEKERRRNIISSSTDDDDQEREFIRKKIRGRKIRDELSGLEESDDDELEMDSISSDYITGTDSSSAVRY